MLSVIPENPSQERRAQDDEPISEEAFANLIISDDVHSTASPNADDGDEMASQLSLLQNRFHLYAVHSLRPIIERFSDTRKTLTEAAIAEGRTNPGPDAFIAVSVTHPPVLTDLITIARQLTRCVRHARPDC